MSLNHADRYAAEYAAGRAAGLREAARIADALGDKAIEESKHAAGQRRMATRIADAIEAVI